MRPQTAAYFSSIISPHISFLAITDVSACYQRGAEVGIHKVKQYLAPL